MSLKTELLSPDLTTPNQCACDYYHTYFSKLQKQSQKYTIYFVILPVIAA